MRARIFQQPKTAMQSGLAFTNSWVLLFPPTHRELNDPMMGWGGGDSTRGQVSLRFDTKDEAVGFAEREGIEYELEIPPPRGEIKPKAYADNFRYNRLENWTH